MKITRVQAHPISFRVPEGQNVRLGIGRAVKRDAVLVKVDTDVTGYNPFRDQMGSAPYALDAHGCVRPLEAPGIGIEVDAAFIAAHPLIDGPCYV